MSDEETRKKLLILCPELETGLNEGDVNKYIIETLQSKIVLERKFNYLLERFICLMKENEEIKNKLQRLSPLVRASEEEQK